MIEVSDLIEKIMVIKFHVKIQYGRGFLLELEVLELRNLSLLII
jgi:hypothetical protein